MTQHYQTRVPSEAEMRQAISDRDGDYDDLFFYGVITTGVFCLPSCAARPARPENLRFYFDTSTAESAGFRPCKRCRPEARSSERQALIELAQFIAQNASEPLTLQTLAQRVDMGTTVLQKRFKALFDVSPKEYQNKQRLKEFKTALRSGSNITTASQDAGFSSSSRVFNAASRNIGMTPTAYRAGGEGETIYHAYRTTELGPLLMAATRKGVCFVQFGVDDLSLLSQLKREFPNAALKSSRAEHSPELDAWIEGLNNHLAGQAPKPDVPLDIRGTVFQIRVWRYLLSIKEGDVVSYAEVARGIGRATATRAVASSCARNRIGVLIPCHRVLRGDGALSGYRWGVERKRSLIALERARRD